MKGVCEFEGCERPKHGSTYCNGHYRQLKQGKELKPLRILYLASSGMSELERFMKRVAVGKPDECWEWTASRKKNWYGNWRGVDGKTEGAHRSAWRLMRGPVPGGLFVLHRCDNPICVNPCHLFLGTQGDNLGDMHQKGRAGTKARKGQKHGMSKLTDEQAKQIMESKLSPKELAEKFGVSRSAIYHIREGYTWKHL